MRAPGGTISPRFRSTSAISTSDAQLRPSDQGHRTVTLPPVHRKGMLLLRVVYRGDSRYKALDSTGPHWFSSQQYIQVG